jgi:hypothetical protein
MTQATTHSQTILEKLHTLTPQQQQEVIDFRKKLGESGFLNKI